MSKPAYMLAGEMGDERGWFIYLGDALRYQPERHTVTAAWADATTIAGYSDNGWWFVPSGGWDTPPVAIQWQHEPTTEVVGYTLGADFTHLESERYPLRLTPDEYSAKAGDYDEPLDPSIRAMYETVTAPKEHELHERRDFLILDGEPPPRDDRVWQAKLPYELAHRVEYLHLFPGRLLGFTDAVKARLEALSDLKIDFYTHGSSPSIFVRVPGGSGCVYHSDSYRVPAAIDGENRADATEKWDRKLAEVEADVRAKCEVCEHCQGTGLPPHKRNPPKARKGRRQ